MLKEVSPNKCDIGVQPDMNMAAETGNVNIFGTTIDRIEISTANLGVFTTSLKKLSPGYYDKDRKPKRQYGHQN